MKVIVILHRCNNYRYRNYEIIFDGDKVFEKLSLFRACWKEVNKNRSKRQTFKNINATFCHGLAKWAIPHRELLWMFMLRTNDISKYEIFRVSSFWGMRKAVCEVGIISKEHTNVTNLVLFIFGNSDVQQ